MKTPLALLTAMATIVSPLAAENKATAEWLAHAGDVQNIGTEGKSIRTVIRMKVFEGWHTYWINPGEAGLPPKLTASLPEGWKISPLQYPKPKRFLTGELPGFGYEGTVDFPVTLTPPTGATKAPEFSGKLTWLTCNDSGCVPGASDLTLKVSDKTDNIENAYDSIPKPLPDAKLTLNTSDKDLEFTLTLAPGTDLDPASLDVFPVTTDTVDPAAKPRFKKKADSPETWIAIAPKNEYLSGEPGAVTLLLVGSHLWEITSSSD